MFHDETQPESHLERSTPLPLQTAVPDPVVQRKRMLIALGILLLALGAVILKDWDFWFPPSAEVQEAAIRSKSKSMPAAPASTQPATPVRERKPAKSPAPCCGRSSLLGHCRARCAASSAGGSRSRKPPHQRACEKQRHPSGCGLGRNIFRIEHAWNGSERRGQRHDRQWQRAGATLATNHAECDRVGSTGLSVIGAANEGAGRGQSAGAHLERRLDSGAADSQWSEHSGSRGARSREAVALQALPAERSTGGNAGPHHGELYHFNQLRH
jgi:hypothetical protein